MKSEEKLPYLSFVFLFLFFFPPFSGYTNETDGFLEKKSCCFYPALSLKYVCSAGRMGSHKTSHFFTGKFDWETSETYARNFAIGLYFEEKKKAKNGLF